MKSSRLALMTSCISLCMPLAIFAEGNGLSRQGEVDRQTLIEAFEEAKNEAQSLSTKLQTLEQQIAELNKGKEQKRYIQEVREISVPSEKQIAAESEAIGENSEDVAKSRKFIEAIQDDHRTQQASAQQRLSKKLIKQKEAPEALELSQIDKGKEIVELKAKKLLGESEIVANDMDSPEMQMEGDAAMQPSMQPSMQEGEEVCTVECCEVEVPCQTVCCCPTMRVGYGFFFTGEWLYWKFSEGGTEFAVDYNPNLPGELRDAHSKKVTFDWESGFRVSAGYQFPQNGWELFATYTQVLPDGSESSNANAFPLLYYQDGSSLQANIARATADWDIHFRTLDVELAQKYCVTKSLSWRPHFGLKAAWIHQHFHVTYHNPAIAFSPPPIATSISVKERNEFEGVGVQAGFDSQWNMGCGFSLFGKLAGALLVSEFELHQTQELFTTGSPTFEQIDLKTRFHVLSPMARIAIGLEWERGISCDTMMLHFNIGFEGQYWWNQNRLERFTSVTQPVYLRVSEDLGMYGLTLGGGLDF